MTTIDKSIFIGAPVEEVFAYADNPASVPDYWPSMLEVSDIEKLPSGGHSFRWKYNMAGIKLNGSTDTPEYEVNKGWVIESKGGVKLTGTWTFKPEGFGTRLTIVHEYTIPIPVLGKLAESFVAKVNENEVQTLLENLKIRLEA